jgi:hypothetical protein
MTSKRLGWYSILKFDARLRCERSHDMNMAFRPEKLRVTLGRTPEVGGALPRNFSDASRDALDLLVLNLCRLQQ